MVRWDGSPVAPVPPTSTQDRRGQLLLPPGRIRECGPVPREEEWECFCVPLRDRAHDQRAPKAVLKGPILLGFVIVKIIEGIFLLFSHPEIPVVLVPISFLSISLCKNCTLNFDLFLD